MRLVDVPVRDFNKVAHHQKYFLQIVSSTFMHQNFLLLLWLLFPSIIHTKKKVLCERKRHTARRVASARSAVLSWGGKGGGTPF